MNSNHCESNSDLIEGSFSSRFQHYRKNKMFTDVKIKIGNLETEAYRAVLEDSSRVIKAMLNYDGNVLEFKKENVDPKILEDLLDFIYDVEIEITSENAFPLCLASNFLDITNLIKKCETFFCKTCSPENVLDLYEFSVKY